MVITSLSQAPWPWSLDQPQRPLSAAPGSALAGPLAEDPAPPAEGAAGAPAIAAPARPADQPAPQRVGPGQGCQAPGRQGPEAEGQGGGPPPGPAGHRGVNLYV